MANHDVLQDPDVSGSDGELVPPPALKVVGGVVQPRLAHTALVTMQLDEHIGVGARAPAADRQARHTAVIRML
jgi:hypothetical protein